MRWSWKWLLKNEECDKKKKILTFKVEEFEELECDKDINLLVCVFKMFIKYEKQPQSFQHKKEEKSSFVTTCF